MEVFCRRRIARLIEALLGSMDPRQESYPWDFAARLTTTIVPERHVGSGTPTFTRALAAYQIDFEGLHHLVPSGATRMQGSRYVQNYTPTDIATWNLVGTATRAQDAVAPDGTTTAWTINFPASGDQTRGTSTIPSTGLLVAPSVWLKADAPGEIRVVENTAGEWDLTASVTTAWKRFAPTPATATTTNQQFRIGRNDAGQLSKVYVWYPQLEDVTGQTNTAPAEPVTLGVLSAPYHGANVDGVKYFDTLNGNTVTSNVVTEATGAHIDSSQAACAGGVTAGVVDASGPLGILPEGARTNLEPSSQYSVAYENSVNITVIANDATAPDGTTTATRITETIANNVHLVGRANPGKYTWTQGVTYTNSVFVKDTAGRGFAAIDFDGNGSADYLYKIFKFSDQTFSNGPSAGTVPTGVTTGYQALPNGWYRIWITGTWAAATSTDSFFDFGFASDASTISYTGDTAKYMHWFGRQSEAGAFPSSYIGTTTIAVTRPASVDQYVSAGNLGTTSSIYMEIAPSVALGSTTVFHLCTYVDADNYTAILSDGTNLIARKRIAGANHDATIAWTRTVNTVAKVAVTFDEVSGIRIALDGTLGTADATTTAAQIGTNFQVGADGNGANQDFCEHRNVRIKGKPFTTRQLELLTAA